MNKSFHLFLVFLFSIFCISCQNIFNGSELRNRITEEITYANSKATNILFDSSCGKISPNGIQPYKVTDTINLVFSEDGDYQFVRWQILDNKGNDVTEKGYINIDDPKNLSSSATFKKNIEKGVLKVVPLCALRPKVISWTPTLSYEGAYRDARIAVSFSRSISSDSIYFTDEELSQSEFQNAKRLCSTVDGKKYCYGLEIDNEIIYKNIKVINKNNGQNLLKYFGEPSLEGNDTFILPTKNGENAPYTGTQIVVELKDFFYEYENEKIKMPMSHVWHYIVNEKTDTESPSLPDGYSIEVSGKNKTGSERKLTNPSTPNDKQSYINSYLKDNILKIDAKIYDLGSGVAPDGYDENRKLVTSGFWCEIRKIKDSNYNTIDDSQTVQQYLSVSVVSHTAYCNDVIDFSTYEDGIYKIDFFAKDKNGNKTSILKTVHILIDKTAPEKVSSIEILPVENELLISWSLKNNASPIDFEKFVLRISKTDINGDTQNIETKEIKSSDSTDFYHSISFDTAEIGTRYDVYLKIVDFFGNESDEQLESIIPVTNASFQSLVLDKYHVSCDDKSGVTATLFFDALDEDSENALRMGLFSKSDIIERKKVIINKSSKYARATFDIPKTSRSNVGKDYSIRLLLNDSVVKDSEEKEISVRFNVSDYSQIDSVLLDKNSFSINNISNDSKILVTIKGYNLDLAKTLSAQIYKSNGGDACSEEYIYDTSSLKWTSTKNSSGLKSLEKYLPLPQCEGTFDVVIKIDSIEKEKVSFNITGSIPVFSKFLTKGIISPKDKDFVNVIVSGKYLDKINLENCTVTCESISKLSTYNSVLKKINSSRLSFTLPNEVGEHKLTISDGLTSYTENIYIKKSCNLFAGDLILSDGYFIPYSPSNDANFLTTYIDDAELIPIAIVFATESDEYAKAIGIYNDYKSYTWTQKTSPGYNTSFSKTICNTPYWDDEDYALEELYFEFSTITGDFDGENNWSEICSIDKTGTSNAEENYPAFYYANNYGLLNNLPNNYKSSWYIPSLYEFSQIWAKKNIINKVLSIIPSKYGAVGLWSEYWTSSQNPFESDCVTYVNLEENLFCIDSKDSEKNVLTIRKF